MAFPLTHNNQVYCWLRCTLEPAFRVVAEPETSYYSEFLYCYRVFNGNVLVKKFRGDFRDLQPGQLVAESMAFVASLQLGPDSESEKNQDDCCGGESPATPVVASRLIPLRTDATYFSSGRAAFTWLLGSVLRPRRVWLPTYVCWSLVSAMQQRFPATPLMFYSVDRDLRCQWPEETESGDAIVLIHYFGHMSEIPDTAEHCIQLSDISHLLLPPPAQSGQFSFGSLRKTFRIADGGVLQARHDPIYESDDGLAVWLRSKARDWRELREAENMMDRDWRVSDMSSQSLAKMLSYDLAAAALQRQNNLQFLAKNFPAGQPLIQFRPGEVPLLHNVLLPDLAVRDSLRKHLASRGIYCSVHWPLHPLLQEQSDVIDSRDAAWLAEHILSLPVADDFEEAQMARICDAAAEWYRAGG